MSINNLKANLLINIKQIKIDIYQYKKEKNYLNKKQKDTHS